MAVCSLVMRNLAEGALCAVVSVSLLGLAFKFALVSNW